MIEGETRKFRSWETWAAARRAWEAGETAASVARRFDVGLANLWRRRAAEGWSRREVDDPAPEPPEGWDLYAERQLQAFDRYLADVRELAQDLAGMMAGGPMDGAPLWHLGFLYRWRAERLGSETAARDRARAVERGQPWVEAFWDADGQLNGLAQLDYALMRLYREEWRRWAGLPEGVAPTYP